jgi:uncharacterized protein YlxW (UPF0749 family)
MSTQTPISQTPTPSLLERFLAEAVVDDYRDVEPAAPDPTRPHRSSPWAHWRSVPVALLIGLIIAAAVVTARGSEQARQATRTDLVDRVAALNATIETRQAEVTEQATAVSELQDQILRESRNAGRAAEIDRLSVAAGASELAGPGLIVTVDDAPGADAGSLNRVLDRDLQDIVNALWQMGATGVSVNDLRLTSATAIRAAGSAILVDYQPLVRPYVVRAVGTVTAGGEESGLQRLLDGLSDDYGLVTEVSTGDVTLPAGEARTPRFTDVVEEQS